VSVAPVTATLLGCAAVLAFDALCAVITRSTGVAYGRFAAGSLLLYCLAGYLAARSDPRVIVGAAAGAAVAATEATVGWRIARAMGVDKEARISQGEEIVTTVSVTIIGAILGAAASLAA